MAQLTFTQIVAAITDRSQMSGDQARIQLAAQLAVKHLSNMFNFPQLEDVDTITAADSTINTALPSLFKGLYDEKSVTLEESGKKQHLKVKTPGQFFSDHPNPEEDSEGEPREVTIFENQLWWFPVPDTNYTIQLRFFKYHGAFDGSNDHVFGEQFDRAIIWLCTGYTYEATQEYNDSAYWIATGEKEARKARSTNLLGRATMVSKSLYGPNEQVTSDSTDYGRIIK